MDGDDQGDDVAVLTRLADRLDALGDTADLMGDTAAAAQFRERAADLRLQAMAILDD